MVRVEVISQFNLERFNELKNIERKRKDIKGSLFVGDTFECTQEMAEYLMKTNPKGKEFVKIIEIIPEKIIEKPQAVKKTEEIEKPKRKRTTTRKTNNKTKTGIAK